MLVDVEIAAYSLDIVQKLYEMLKRTPQTGNIPNHHKIKLTANHILAKAIKLRAFISPLGTRNTFVDV